MRKIVIGAIVAVFGIVILSVSQYTSLVNLLGWSMVKTNPLYPTDGWLVSTPEEEGIDSNTLIKGYQDIISRGMNAHSLLLVRNGRIVDETYFYPYQKDDMINIHSCTKSIVSALVGIAIEEGYIKSVDQRILDFFSDRNIKNLTPGKQSITIRHLLTMSSGLAVNHPDDEMKSSSDWVRYVLDLDMAEDPGTRFNYSDAIAHLLSAILQRATGMSTYDYANSHLFRPMGIKVIWPKDPQGINSGFGEINMTPRDMAKFGYLYLNKGMWDGKQLVPENWVKESTKKQIKTGMGDDYGYLWWCPSLGFQARGAGEQYIIVVPAFNIVAVSANGLDEGEGLNLDAYAGAVKLKKLPPNPEGLEALRKLEKQLEISKPGEQKIQTPEIASKICGKTYYFPKGNLFNVREMVMDFSSENEISIKGIGYDGNMLEARLPADGSFVKDTSRKNTNDTLFTKGCWQDDKTFTVVSEKSQRQVLFFTFEDNTVTIRSEIRGKIVFDKLTGSQR